MSAEGQEDLVDPARRAAALYSAVQSGLLPAPESIEDKPLALFYDLNAWEKTLRTCGSSLAPNGCTHVQ